MPERENRHTDIRGGQLTSSQMLRTLGGLSLGRFRQTKPLLLLTYLALQGPTARRDLRVLLWPHSQRPDASLRVAMHLLKKADEHAIKVSNLLECGVDCDATTLLTLRGQAAIDAYTGAFLLGVGDLEVSPEFDDWVEAQRVRLALHAQEEALTLAEESAPERAVILAERAYRLPGLPPSEPDVLRRLLAVSLPGSVLEGELRDELSTLATKADQWPKARPAGRMLGREAELDALLSWAVVEHAEWLALVSGPGGIGKSMLLRELYRELIQQNVRAVLVDAEGAQHSSEVLGRLLAMLSPGRTVPETWAGAGTLLGERAVMLLDGLDDLQDLPGLLHELSGDLPSVRWVLAGRRSLSQLAAREQRLDGVMVVHLSGLEVPALDATFSEAAACGAVDLFLREGARVRRDLDLTGNNLALIAGLARRLFGHPLALTLAASWLRVEPLQAVAARVLQDAGSLTSPGGDRDGRRGLVVVAQRSWSLLSAAEQDAALRLSVCSDVDPKDAAALGVPDDSLTALLANSFLEAYQPGSERLRLYPALSGLLHMQAQRVPEHMVEIRRVHTEHYLAWFAEQAPESSAVDAERENLRRAVLNALEHHHLESVTLDRLLSHYDVRGLHSSGIDLFAEIVDKADHLQAPFAVQASAQIGCMWLAYRAGRLVDAQTLSALFLQGPLAADPASRMKALNTLASVRSLQGKWQQAGQLYEQARLLARQLGDQVREISYQSNRLTGLLHQSEEALIQQEIARVEMRLSELPDSMAWQVRRHLISVKVHLTAVDVTALQEEAMNLIRWGEEHANLSMIMTGLMEGSRLHLLAGRHRESSLLMTRLQSLLASAEHGEIETDLAVLETEWLYLKGRAPQARRRAAQALELASVRLNPWDFAELLIVSAADLMSRDPQGTAYHLAAVSGSERLIYSQRRRAEALLEVRPEVAPPLDLPALEHWLWQLFQRS